MRRQALHSGNRGSGAFFRRPETFCRLMITFLFSQGIRQIKQTDLNPVFVFLSPPSMGTLRERLQDRGTESDAAIQQRLATCLKEIEYAREPGAHDIVLVVDDYEKTYLDFRKVAFGERIVGDILPALDD